MAVSHPPPPDRRTHHPLASSSAASSALLFTAANDVSRAQGRTDRRDVDSGGGDIDGDPAIVQGFIDLENNIVQTIASAAGTLAAIIFVLPGLVVPDGPLTCREMICPGSAM